jgi:putative FmdB family regulatory protein
MPTYSYRCTACETAFDVQQAFAEDSLTVCPTCGGALRKVFGSVGVTFTGSGFYRNDSRVAPREGGSESTSSEKKSAPAPSSSSSTEKSSAPAPKSPAPTTTG